MFSDLERQIGLKLYEGERTAEELAEELGADIRDVLDALKHLMKLKIVVKEGYPPKYRLSDHIRESLKRDMEEVEGIKIHAVIEAQAIEEELVRKALEQMKRNLNKERGVHIVSANPSEIRKDEETGMYSAFMDLVLVFEGFEPLMHFLFFYGPSVVEVLGPERVSFDMGDLQRGLLEAASMIQGYVAYITKLMSEKELRDFNKQLFQRLFK